MVQASVKKECIKYLQSDLEKTFFEAGIYETMKNQLADYINFVTLLKNPQAVLEHTEIFTNTKVAVYGAGGFGQAVLKQYSDSISLVADSNYIKFNNISSPVISPEELVSRQSEFDKVFITILNINLCEKIRDSLLAMGLKKEVIFYSVKG